MNGDILSAALAAIKAGLSIVPINHTTKKPIGRWKRFQSEIASEAEVRRWFTRGAKAFAVVCGAVSGGLLIFDFDVPGFYERWRDAIGVLTIDLTAVQRTGGGGYQVMVKCPTPGGNEKLAWAVDESEETGRTIAIETRGEGGYAVVAPSLHPSGNRYVMIAGRLAEIPIVSEDDIGVMLAAALKLDQCPMTRQEREQAEAHVCDTHKRRQASQNGQASVIEAFNQAHDIATLLKQHGYTEGRGGRFCRPGRDVESISIRDGRSCHFSSNDALNDGKVKSGLGCHDAFGVYCHFEHGGDTRAAVKAAAMLLGMDKPKAGAEIKPVEPWPDPQPLPDGLPPVLPFDFDLLPMALHGWVKDISDRMQCPPDYCAATAMVMAGALIGRTVAIRPKRRDDWQVLPNLFGMMVGRPSLMKSPAMKDVMAFVRRAEVKSKQEYQTALAEHAASSLISEATKRVKKEELKKAVKDGGDAKAIADAMAKDTEEMPTRKRWLVNDTTVEKLGVILNENPNGVLIFMDELISLLRTMDREGHEADRGFYLMAWAGDSRFTYDRIGRGTLDIESAIVSILGAIQPGVVNDYLRGAVAGGGGDDGLMQRFQMTVWPDVPAGPWQNIDRHPDTDAKARAFAALQRLADLTPGIVEAERDNFDTDAVPFLHFDHYAQQDFNQWRADLENRLRSGEEHPAIESHLAKYRSLIPSVALIVHLLDGGSGPVSADALAKAIGWGKYLESHARRLYAGVTQSAAIASRALAAKIQKRDVADLFSARDVYLKGWAGLDRAGTESAIELLLSLHWIEERIEPTTGRPKTRYAVNPKIVTTQRAEPTKPTKGAFEGFVGSVSGADAFFKGDGREQGEL